MREQHGTIELEPAAPRPARAGAARTCEGCERIEIGRSFEKASPARVFVGLIFVYLPIVFLPLYILSGLSVYVHLRIMGARNLKTLRDFMPDPASHRYSRKTQIVYDGAPAVAFWTRLRAFWLFNCTFYCPTSVAVLEWNTYLVKAVENWWCPFHHGKKGNYAGSALDSTFWHQTDDVHKLHPDDKANPIWSPPR
jgi:hypothetical protein